VTMVATTADRSASTSGCDAIGIHIGPPARGLWRQFLLDGVHQRQGAALKLVNFDKAESQATAAPDRQSAPGRVVSMPWLAVAALPPDTLDPLLVATDA
jgi:hypothetical protein